MNYAFNRSRNLLIEQEAGIISQYMNRNELALTDITDSIRKLSAASSTNKQVSALLSQSYEGNVFSSENAGRIRSVEETLTFYRNIFFDYRMHYIILGVDGTVYSVTDGIDNSTYFGKQFSESVLRQDWYYDFMDSQEVSRWVIPCTYNDKGVFISEGDSSKDEDFILFIRRIRDYNSQKFLGVSFVSFPTENLSQILIPYEGAAMALFNQEQQLVYANEDADLFHDISVDNMDLLLKEHDGYFHYTLAEREYLINYVTMDSSGWRLVNMVPLDKTTEAVDKLYSTVTTMMILIAIGASVVCLVMYVYVNAPLNRLILKISSINIGGTVLSDVEGVEGFASPVFGIVEAEHEINQMVDYIEKLSAQTIKQKEIEQNLRYEMLRAQLNPHFLFNTLNVIKWSAIISGAGNIADMITSLGILLENTMNRGEEEGPLREEIRVAKAWVEIKNWALKNRIQIHADVPEALEDFQVIRFFLQPLVENAVFHGMEDVENGEIWIKAEQYNGRVCVTIQDNGIGIESGELDEILKELDVSQKRRNVTGIGLTSIHELMKLKYGQDYGLYIESKKNIGTKVYVIFPDWGGMDAENNDCG
ncbi:cache domain-containing sensor histidine kinase [Lacrimispora sp.]|uniref:cache domain-containing sensor histidine kinase n=1 Tax=Lacrimispora sp. TaxID=2719234 RepID=UPI0028972AC6|nr:histidine kinase [Lacrimispora sp.]